MDRRLEEGEGREEKDGNSHESADWRTTFETSSNDHSHY